MAKAFLHSAKGLPSVALGKPHSVKKVTVKASLPSVFFRALGKVFAECQKALGKLPILYKLRPPPGTGGWGPSPCIVSLGRLHQRPHRVPQPPLVPASSVKTPPGTDPSDPLPSPFVRRLVPLR